MYKELIWFEMNYLVRSHSLSITEAHFPQTSDQYGFSPVCIPTFRNTILALTPCAINDFYQHINTISMEVPIIYFKGSWVLISKLWCISDSFTILALWVLGTDSLFPISMSPTANLWVQNTIFNDKSAILLHPGTGWNKNLASQRQNYAQKIQDVQLSLLCLAKYSFKDLQYSKD